MVRVDERKERKNFKKTERFSFDIFFTSIHHERDVCSEVRRYDCFLRPSTPV